MQEMVQYLRTLGYDEVFNDSHTIAADELFWNRIETGIRESDAFVVILSHASVKSYWVDREVQFARENGKKVIPIRIDDCKLPPQLRWSRRHLRTTAPRAHDIESKLATSHITKHSPKILFGRDQSGSMRLDAVWSESEVECLHTRRLGRRRQDVARRPPGVSQRMAAKGLAGR